MSKADKPTVLIMAGGTGGHIFPALATAKELQARGANIHWLGTPDSMEAELVPKHGFEISFIPVTGLRGKGISFLLKAPFKLTRSLIRVLRIIRQQRPVCVLGMGGYVTGPGGLGAKLAGVPLVIHEQNAIAGFTNRVLSKLADKVLLAFPEAFAADQGAKFTCVGNPVRTDIAENSALEFSDRPLRLLVVGGSRGSVAINELVPKVLAHFDNRIEVWHQTGKNNDEVTNTIYRDCRVQGKVEAFIDDMASAYQWADLVLCRSGALTVSELALAKRPAILVPYPYAVDDHQSANGRFLVEQGAAFMVQQKDLNETRLTELLEELVSNPEKLIEMAEAAGNVARPRATMDVADCCLEVANVN